MINTGHYDDYIFARPRITTRALDFLSSFCSNSKSIDISEGEYLTNASIIYRGKMYNKRVQRYDKEKIKVCPCNIYQCYRKCCEPKKVYSLDFNKCLAVSEFPSIYNETLEHIRYLDKELEKIENALGITPIYGFEHLLTNCEPEGQLISTTLFLGNVNLSTTGNLSVTSCNITEIYNVDEYCFNTFISFDPESQNYEIEHGAYFCSRRSDSEQYNGTEDCEKHIQVKIMTQNFTGIFVSSGFILLTIVLQLLLPEATNNKIYRYNMMAHLISMLNVSISIAVTRLIVSLEITTDYTVRLTISTIIYFEFLATFFWLNVMCFDVWKTLSGRRGRVLPGDVLHTFYKYCAYAFGFPTGLTLLFLLLEIVPSGDSVLPRMRKQESFLNGITKDIYLKVPIGIICVINAILVITTIISININKRKNSQILKATENTVHSEKKYIKKIGKWLHVYTKLFAVSCLSMFSISWYLEIISDMFPENMVLWKIHDVFDYISGLLTLICVLANRNTFRAFKTRFCRNIKSVSRPISDTDLSNSTRNLQQSALEKESTNTVEDCVMKTNEFEEKVITRL